MFASGHLECSSQCPQAFRNPGQTLHSGGIPSQGQEERRTCFDVHESAMSQSQGRACGAVGNGFAKTSFLSSRYKCKPLCASCLAGLPMVAEQNEKGDWDQKHWEDLMLKVNICCEQHL